MTGDSQDFLCYLAGSAPGESWESLKEQVDAGDVQLEDGVRWRCVQNLLRALSALEHGEIIHGDLSLGNIVVDRGAVDRNPSLSVIDLDAFVAARAGTLGRLPVEVGGVYGTEDYCPPELRELSGEALLAAAPCSDRHARDMLVLELLCFEQGCPVSDAPWKWPRGLVADRLQQTGVAPNVLYLARPDLFQLPEHKRLSSRELAQAFGASVPPRIKHRQRGAAGSHRRMTWTGAGIETTLRIVVLLLWLLCAGHWSVVSFAVGGWLVGAPAAGLFAAGMQWFAAIGLLLAGMIGLSTLTLAEWEPTFVEIGSLTLRFPPRRNCARSEARHLVFVAGQLLGVLLGLAAVVWLIVRFGG